MFAAALIPLFALVYPVICQTTTGGSDYTGFGPSFQPDPLTTGILAVFCLFTFFFLVLIPWCFVALILARGHRSPYAFLLPALILSFLGNGANIALEVLLNMPSWYVLPTQVEPALQGIQWFFINWAILLLFLSLIAVLWNRENAIYAATGGKSGQRNHAFTAIYAVLAVLLFALGTATPAVYVDALRKYLITLDEIDSFSFDSDTSLEQYELNQWYDQRVIVWSDLSYTFNTFVVLSGIVVVVSTILLWRKSRAAGIRDKITDSMLCAVAPLYAVYNIVIFIFTIVFSNHGLPADSSQTTWESATLAENILVFIFYCAVAFALLFLSANRANWNLQGGTIQPTNVPTQQYYAQPPMQPYYGSQQYMQPYNAQPVGQPTYYYNGPQSHVPESQAALHSPQTQQESLENPSRPTTLG